MRHESGVVLNSLMGEVQYEQAQGEGVQPTRIPLRGWNPWTVMYPKFGSCFCPKPRYIQPGAHVLN